MREQLDALEAELASAHTPEALVDLAGRVDALGRQIAAVAAGDPAHGALLVRVPPLYVRILLLAAERYDDRGSPRRAAVVLLEALRRAFTPAALGTVGEALAFLLEAHEQPAIAARVRALVDHHVLYRSLGRATSALDDEITAIHGAIDWARLPDDRFD